MSNTIFSAMSNSNNSTTNAMRLEGVRTRRVLAFLLDYLIVGVLTVVASIAIAILGIITFGLGWVLYLVVLPLTAIAYVALTMGGPKQATVGMQMFAIRLEKLDGELIDPFYAILHSVIFWIAHIVMTPFMLLVSLFSSRKRLVQDILLGTIIVRSDT